MAKLWAGRTDGQTDRLADDFNSSIGFDCRMYRQDITGSMAHAAMLGATGILPKADADTLIDGLQSILDDLGSGKLQFDPTCENIHMFVEQVLTERLGDVGKKLHTARSRNDQVALDLRMYLREQCDAISAQVKTLIEALVDRAEHYKSAIMPGYTHLQRAQPITFGHHLMAYAMMLLRDRSRLADMGLYQGRRIGPYVEQTYLQLLEQRYLPSLFNGLVKAMNAAPPESEEKLAVLRVMRMLEDKSGRNNEVVKQYMAKRWSEKFHGQRDIQAQLMSHLDYALAHTDWHAERQAGDGDAISRWTPYDKPVVSAQKELSKLPVYQRVYQSLKTRALGVLPADLNLRDQVGPTFDQVFTSADDNKLVVPQFLTRYGLQSYFVKQRDELVELTAMDSWVLNLTRSVKYSDADRAEIQRQLTEQYISDYTATWRAGMDNLNIRNFESIGQLTGALEQVISGDQPLQRALTVLRDNTQPGVFSEKLSAKEREEALAEPDYQLLTRLGHEFAPENSTLAVQKDKESTMQAVYQQLTELHRYLLAIQNAPVPGKSALKAVQLRLDQNSSDPIFATRQMAKTLPAPLNRWVGRLTDQAWHVVMVEAVHYMEVDWRDSVVKPFNEQLANNYPFNPRSAQDASLDAFERFFKPDGILDTFYQQNLKLFIDNDLSLEDGDNNVIIREDIIAQLETAQKIRDIFFSKQNGLGTSFAVETVSLSGNKRRSVLNLDGQLVDYSQGRNYTAHLVWPNNMREGNESKLTLIGTSGNAPRSISFSGPWAQFRLFGAGQLTGVQDGNFTVRFSVDGGAMTYRVHTDTEDNPFSGGLFSQFGLSDTLY